MPEGENDGIFIFLFNYVPLLLHSATIFSKYNVS